MSNTQRLLVSRNKREGWYFGPYYYLWERRAHCRTRLRWLSLRGFYSG